MITIKEKGLSNINVSFSKWGALFLTNGTNKGFKFLPLVTQETLFKNDNKKRY
jgi:hypothetical protein